MTRMFNKKRIIKSDEEYEELFFELLMYDPEYVNYGIKELYNEYKNFKIEKLILKSQYSLKNTFMQLADEEAKEGNDTRWRELLLAAWPWDPESSINLEKLINSPNDISRQLSAVMKDNKHTFHHLRIHKAICDYTEPSDQEEIKGDIHVVKVKRLKNLAGKCYDHEVTVKAIVVDYMVKYYIFPEMTVVGNKLDFLSYFLNLNRDSIKNPFRDVKKYTTDKLYNESAITPQMASGMVPAMKAADDVFNLFAKCFESYASTQEPIIEIRKDINSKIEWLERRKRK